jgi:hypothetical protein
MNDNDYIDRSGDDIPDWRPLSNPADKTQLYSEVVGMSEAQPIEEKPKVPRRLDCLVRSGNAALTRGTRTTSN